jgi:lipoprotein-anchoring transpeptidase ErfK/SrfK
MNEVTARFPDEVPMPDYWGGFVLAPLEIEFWQGQPDGGIVHRILWLEGLEPGLNRGGNVDTFRRYVYIHGFGDELTLGRPQSCGCIHLSGADLMPLYDRLPVGTLVWIDAR